MTFPVAVEDVTEGKYYETRLVFTLPDGRTVSGEFSSADPQPSKTEIEDNSDCDDWPSDGHYERDATRQVVDLIMELVRGVTW